MVVIRVFSVINARDVFVFLLGRKFRYADKERFLEMYTNNTGIRKVAKFLCCSPSLLVRCVRELAGNFRFQLELARNNLSANSIPETIEMDEIYTRIKKGAIEFPYGLLIIGGEVKLLRIL